jgi:RimJ/RimL family protein N-acetyltransferase
MFNQEGYPYPQKVALKDGTEVILRPMVPEDEDALLNFFRKIPQEDRLYLADDVTNRAVIRKWCKDLDYERVLPLLTEMNGEIIADTTLQTNRAGWMRHVGELRGTVSLEYRRKGVATIGFSRLVEHAVMMGLDKIVFRAMSTQLGAIRCMESVGFEKEAVLKDHVTDLRGRPHDLVIMTNYVAELWRKMEDAILDSEFRIIP